MLYIVSGYFATLTEGHKEYFDSVINLMKKDDKLLVIVANPFQFSLKYKNFCPPTWKICEPIISFLSDKNIEYGIYRAIDRDKTIRETLKLIRSTRNDEIVFVKDGGEYNKENLPEKEVENINFLFLNNPKISNASEILNIEKKDN